MDIQQLAWRYFSKKNGYALRPDVISYLLDRIKHSNVPNEKVAKLLEYIADNFAAIVGKSVEIVDRKTLEDVVEKLFKAKITVTAHSSADPRDFCSVVSSATLGNWKYNERSNAFERANTIDGPRQHYTLLRKRLGLLMPAMVLHNINSLKGKEIGALVTCFGMVQEFKEGQFYLEDLDDAVKLQISQDCAIDYAICKNFYSLVTGVINEKGELVVQEIRSTPAMNMEDHKKLLPTIDYNLVMKRLEKKHEIEAVESNTRDFHFCFINDAWLDNGVSRKKLQKLFESLSKFHQIAFVFCGHLFSPSFAGERTLVLKELASLIDKLCPKSLFIFSHNNEVSLFPQAPLPSSSFKDFDDHSIRYYTAQNPTRIVYCTQELVAIDDSLCRQLYRSTLSRLGSLEDLSYEKCKREVI